MMKVGRLFAAATLALSWGLVHAFGTFGSNLEIDTVRGSVMKLEGSHLLVGLQDGGLVSFDPLTRKPRFSFGGDGFASVADVALYGNRAFWAIEGTQRVRTCMIGNTMPMDVDLAGTGLVGPVRRLSVWQEMIVAHGDVGLRFIEPQSLRVRMPDEVLPPDVADMANQGMAITTWKDGSGLFVVVRRYATRKSVQPGEVDDLAMLTAWSAQWRSEYKLLGSYAADLTEFEDLPALNLARRGPSQEPAISLSSGPIGNVKVGAEGIIALNYGEALTIPLYQDNWETARVKTAIPPKYSQTAAYFNSEVWWADGHKLVNASLEDGSTAIFLPRMRGEVKSLVADEDGLWVLLDEGIRRVWTVDDVEDEGSAFVRFDVGGDGDQPTLGGQARLSFVLKTLQKGTKKMNAKSSVEFVKAVLSSAGVPAKKIETLHGPSDTPTELQYGDVVVHAGQAELYIGNGQVATWKEGKLVYDDLDWSPEARIHRFFMGGARYQPGMHSLPITDIGPVFPIGVGKPNRALGHNLFVRINPNSPFDGPHLPAHYQMLQIIESWQGTPYRWGGQSMSGTDCSGFVMQVFRELGVSLPRHSQTMGRAPFGEVVFDELRFGDVLVYPHPKHVAIYIGNGRTAETVKGGVGYSTVYRRNRAVVRRFLADPELNALNLVFGDTR